MAETRERQRPQAKAASVKRENIGSTTYPGRLTYNYETEQTGKEGKVRTVWYQEIARLDQQWSDGNPVIRANYATLVFPSGDFAGKGSEADQLADAFHGIVQCDLLPGNPDAAAFVGHAFEWRDEKIEDTKSLYRRIPVKYLGDETFRWDGNVRTIQPKDGEGGGGDSAPPEDLNLPVAKIVASILDGKTEEEIRNNAGPQDPDSVFNEVVKDERLAGVSAPVLGVSLRGGLLKTGGAVLLTRLVEHGLVQIKDGVVLSTVPAEEG